MTEEKAFGGNSSRPSVCGQRRSPQKTVLPAYSFMSRTSQAHQCVKRDCFSLDSPHAIPSREPHHNIERNPHQFSVQHTRLHYQSNITNLKSTRPFPPRNVISQQPQPPLLNTSKLAPEIRFVVAKPCKHLTSKLDIRFADFSVRVLEVASSGVR
jgi:hypothetical protein